MLNSVLWGKHIVNKTKTLIFKSLVQSAILYGVETWTLGRQQEDKLLATEMDLWWKAARKSRKWKPENQRNVNVQHNIF